MWLILIILGIVAEILKTNAILVIPSIVEYILFGLGGLLLLIQIISYFTARKTIKKTQEHIRRQFDRFGKF